MILERRPDYAALQNELARIKAEHSRLVEAAAREREAAQRQRQASERADDAERLLNLGDHMGAVKMANEALQIVEGHAVAQRVRTEALAIIEQQAAAAVIASRARSHMSKALKHLATGRFDDAIREARSAVELTPDGARARTLAAEAERLKAAHQSALERSQQLQERARTVARLLAQARNELAAGAHVPALRAAEDAVALDESNDTARQVLDQVRSVIALVTNDEEDTLSVAPVEPSDRDAFAGFVGQMKDVGRRLSDRFRGRRS